MMLASPALAQKRHHVTGTNQSEVYGVIPGYDVDGRTARMPNAVYDVIPGYDVDGRTIGIPNPDRFGIQSQR
jgi:hypothetical protein